MSSIKNVDQIFGILCPLPACPPSIDKRRLLLNLSAQFGWYFTFLDSIRHCFFFPEKIKCSRSDRPKFGRLIIHFRRSDFLPDVCLIYGWFVFWMVENVRVNLPFIPQSLKHKSVKKYEQIASKGLFLETGSNLAVLGRLDLKHFFPL